MPSASFVTIDEPDRFTRGKMLSYRLIPVGDKIVLIVEPELHLAPADVGAGYSQVLDGDAGCYDFGSERMSANESFNEITSTVGGYSRE
jgi:hypothetical protein